MKITIFSFYYTFLLLAISSPGQTSVPEIKVFNFLYGGCQAAQWAPGEMNYSVLAQFFYGKHVLTSFLRISQLLLIGND